MPLDLDYITKLLNVRLPPNPSARAGWTLNTDAIIDACALLELKYGVAIRFTAGRQTRGTHREPHALLDPDKHSITLSQDRDAYDSNVTLWHELRHAWQAEQYHIITGKPIGGFYKAYKRADGPHGQSYHLNKFEVDARTYAQRMVDEERWLVK